MTVPTKDLLDAVLLGPDKLGPLIESFTRAEMNQGCCCQAYDLQQIRQKVLKDLDEAKVYETFDADIRARLSTEEIQQLGTIYTSDAMDKFSGLYREVVDPINRKIFASTMKAIKEANSK